MWPLDPSISATENSAASCKKSKHLFCRAKRSCFELEQIWFLFGNKKYPCQTMIIFSASFNYGCVSPVLCACNTMCWNFFQKIFAYKFSWTCLLLDLLLHIWRISVLHYVGKHSKFSMPSFDKQGFQCPKFTCKGRLAYERTPSFLLKKLECFTYILFLPNFELFKLEFSGCVFQAGSFFCWKILVKTGWLFLNLQETNMLLWFWKLMAFFFFVSWKFEQQLEIWQGGSLWVNIVPFVTCVKICPSKASWKVLRNYGSHVDSSHFLHLKSWNIRGFCQNSPST